MAEFPSLTQTNPWGKLLYATAMKATISSIRAFFCVILVSWATVASGLDPRLKFYQYEFPDLVDAHVFSYEVYDVAQDKDGFIWLATSRGLARYDGHEFVLHRTFEYPELLANRANRILFDQKDRLFVASDRGLTVYQDGQFSVISEDHWSKFINDMTRDAMGRVWFASGQGVWSLDEAQFYQHDFGLPQANAVMTHAGKTYVGGDGAFVVVDGQSGQVQNVALDEAYNNVRIHAIEYHPSGQVWVATSQGLFRLEDDRLVLPDDPRLLGKSVTLVLADKDSNLWFYGPETFGRIYPDGDIELPQVDQSMFGFKPQLTRMFEDQFGTHWHTSKFFGFGGIQNPTARRISYSEGLGSPNATAVISDHSLGVIVGTDQGIVQLKQNTITQLLERDFSGEGRVQAFGLGEGDTLLVGTKSGLFTFGLESRSLQRVDHEVLAKVCINGFLRDHGRILVGTDQGVFEISDGAVKLVPETEGLTVRSLMLDTDGRIWMGTDQGIERLGLDGLKKLTSEYELGKVVSLVQLPNGQVIAATAEHGLLVQIEDGWHRIQESDGLLPERIIDLEIENEFLWVTTGGGVFRTPHADLQDITAPIELEPVVTQPRYKGFPDDFCCTGESAAATTIHDGSVYSTSYDGVLVFETSVDVSQVTPPSPYIKSVTASGIELKDTNQVVVLPDNNQIKIDYSALSLTRGHQTTFRYRIPGFIDDWVEVGNTRSLRLQEIPPGTFDFQLQASGLAQVWSDEIGGFSFVREATVFETSSARLGAWAAAVAAGVLLVWLSLVYTRSRREKLQNEIQQSLVELKQVNRELRRANQELRQTSQIDPLTGLVNRRFFDPDNHGALGEAAVEQGLLLMVDIDFFKKVNDSYGHTTGDEILCQFAEVLTSVTRQSDLIARWGGEEFLMICQSLDDDATVLLNRVCETVKSHGFRTPDGANLRLTCSIGCVRYPLWQRGTLWTNFDKLLEFADAALYAVKQQGRDGWAMLRRGPNANIDLKSRRINKELHRFVEQRHLLWSANRPDMSPNVPSSVTRLHQIKSKQKK